MEGSNELHEAKRKMAGAKFHICGVGLIGVNAGSLAALGFSSAEACRSHQASQHKNTVFLILRDGLFVRIVFLHDEPPRQNNIRPRRHQIQCENRSQY